MNVTWSSHSYSPFSLIFKEVRTNNSKWRYHAPYCDSGTVKRSLYEVLWGLWQTTNGNGNLDKWKLTSSLINKLFTSSWFWLINCKKSLAEINSVYIVTFMQCVSNLNFVGVEVKIFVQNPSNVGFRQPAWHTVATPRTVWTSFNGLSHYHNILRCTYHFYTTTLLL